MHSTSFLAFALVLLVITFHEANDARITVSPPGRQALSLLLQKIEAPVRGTIPDQGPPVSERNWGQDVLNPHVCTMQSALPL